MESLWSIRMSVLKNTSNNNALLNPMHNTKEGKIRMVVAFTIHNKINIFFLIFFFGSYFYDMSNSLLSNRYRIFFK